MYVRLFTTIAVVASFAFGSAWAQQDENGQPTQYGAYPGVVEDYIWWRQMNIHVHKHVYEYMHDVDGQKLNKYLAGQKVGRERMALIIFAVNGTGHIVSAKVRKSSGDAVLDKAALTMVRRADPVPLPPSLRRDGQVFFDVNVKFSP